MTEPSPEVVAEVESVCERLGADPAKVHASGLVGFSTATTHRHRRNWRRRSTNWPPARTAPTQESSRPSAGKRPFLLLTPLGPAIGTAGSYLLDKCSVGEHPALLYRAIADRTDMSALPADIGSDRTNVSDVPV